MVGAAPRFFTVITGSPPAVTVVVMVLVSTSTVTNAVAVRTSVVMVVLVVVAVSVTGVIVVQTVLVYVGGVTVAWRNDEQSAAVGRLGNDPARTCHYDDQNR